MADNHYRSLADSDPEIYAAIQHETRRQHAGLELMFDDDR